MWCGDGHLYKECLEKGNTALILTCCNCRLVDGEKPHLCNYRGCRRAKEEVRKRLQWGGCSVAATPTQKYPSCWRYAAASATPSDTGLHRHGGRNKCPPPLRHNQQQVPSQSVQAPNANSSSLSDLFTVVREIFQQIMTELNGAESEDDRIMAITKMKLKLMKWSGH
jgi:hypothetical protein